MGQYQSLTFVTIQCSREKRKNTGQKKWLNKQWLKSVQFNEQYQITDPSSENSQRDKHRGKHT